MVRPSLFLGWRTVLRDWDRHNSAVALDDVLDHPVAVREMLNERAVDGLPVSPEELGDRLVLRLDVDEGSGALAGEGATDLVNVVPGTTEK